MSSYPPEIDVTARWWAARPGVPEGKRPAFAAALAGRLQALHGDRLRAGKFVIDHIKPALGGTLDLAARDAGVPLSALPIGAFVILLTGSVTARHPDLSWVKLYGKAPVARGTNVRWSAPYVPGETKE